MARDVRVARPNGPRYVPAFTVEKLDGKVERDMIKFDSKGEKKTHKVEVDAGYMVRFPAKGHSIRVRDAAHLKRLGFDQTISLVNPENDDDETFGEIPNSITASVA